MNRPQSMALQVLTPDGFHTVQTVDRIVAEAEDGSFCLKPKHRDFTTTLVPGILEYSSSAGTIGYVAIDQGLLVKSEQSVVAWVRHAVASDDLEKLKDVIDVEFAGLEEKERAARSAVSRLEADFARRFLKIREITHV